MGSKPIAYYNEYDPYAAEWLENLIVAGLIADGVVDKRSIKEVMPEDLKGFNQCHFFAGIGVWSHSLRLAGVSDDQHVWTGSCPCQPFSAAGEGKGFEDERHLWPDFFRLIEACQPERVMGEQVASKDGLAWLDLVHTDVERAGYSIRAADTCAAGVGAPHIRQRLYWVADSNDAGLQRCERTRTASEQRFSGGHATECCNFVGMADSNDTRLEGWRESQRECASELSFREGSLVGRLADTDSFDSRQRCENIRGRSSGSSAEQGTGRRSGSMSSGLDNRERPRPTNGFWRDADWLFCTDGKWRPAQARVQQLVNGTPLRVGSLCPDLSSKTKEILDEAAKRLQTETDTLLREVRDAIGSSDIFGPRGGIFSVHEAQILLAYLFEYTGSAREEPEPTDGYSSRSSASRDVRMLWRRRAISDTSYKRELARQPLRELTDPLRILSCAVARFAQESVYPSVYTDAPASFPLTTRSESGAQDSLGIIRPKGRIGRLRAYGNALNAHQAAAFIEAVW